MPAFSQTTEQKIHKPPNEKSTNHRTKNPQTTERKIHKSPNEKSTNHRIELDFYENSCLV